MKKSLDKRKCLCYNIIVPEWACNEVWLSLVERYVRDVEAASSNLVTSTKKTRERHSLSLVFLVEVLVRTCFAKQKQVRIPRSEIAKLALFFSKSVSSGTKRNCHFPEIFTGTETKCSR